MGVTEANVPGNVQGGVIMKLCDGAGGTAAIKRARRPVVPVAVDSTSFDSPVHTGNLLTVKAEVKWVGLTSLETRLVVTYEDVVSGRMTNTNTAYKVYGTLDEGGNTTEVPPLIGETEEEKRLVEEGATRQVLRLDLGRKE